MTFTVDWSQTRGYWADMFADYGLPGQADLHFLEIGCFEGRTTLWLLENVLTDPTCLITVIDTFQGSPEFEHMGVDGDSLDRFTENLADFIMDGKVIVRQGESRDVLRTIPVEPRYDFIYVDGSHYADDVHEDATLAWTLLKPGGVMVFDDYMWGLEGQEEWERPRQGIDDFMSEHIDELEVRHCHYQLVVEKK